MPFSCWAQSITGKIVDIQGQKIAFANVLLCQSSDSTMISGCTSDEDGAFAFALNHTDGIFLRVSFVGYKTKLVELEKCPLKITLEPVILDEVVIMGHRKLYEQKNGEIIANVKGTILEMFPKANDVIAQLPFVSGQNGDFTVFGKGTPIIYINNRLIQDKEELNRLMTSEIKSIKVNTMPGAKYDASVNAVIQIITERSQGEGFSGTLYAGAKRSNLWSTEEYTSLNYRYKAWDMFGSVYFIQNRQTIDMKANQQLTVSDIIHEVVYQEEENVKANRTSAVGGVNFNPNHRISAGLQYVYNQSNWRNDMFNDISHAIGNKKDMMQQFSYFDKPSNSHNINAYYSGSFRNNLSLDVNFDWMKGDETDKMYSCFRDNSSADVNSVGNRQYDFYAAKGVFTYANKYINIEAGAEYSYTDVTQTYNIDNSTLDIDNSNDITKQNRWGLFVSTKAHAGNWGFGAGLRYEDIDFDYYKNNLLNREQSKIYHKFFPNLFVNYSKGKIQILLGYERKIKYPTYAELRSNVQYSSPYVYECGNPLLLPQIQNSFTGILTYKDLKVMLGYTIYEDYIAQLVELYNGEPIALLKTDNVKDVKNRFFVVSYTPAIDLWQPNLEFGGQWQDFNLLGKTYNKPILKIRLNNSLSFPKQWFLNIDTGWRTKGYSGIYMLRSSLQTNISIVKQLFNRKLSVELVVNDVFKTENTQWRINHSNIMFDYDKYSDSRYAQLTIRYNFNATKSKYKGGLSSDEIQRL